MLPAAKLDTMTDNINSRRGGARPGAGRPKTGRTAGDHKVSFDHDDWDWLTAQAAALTEQSGKRVTVADILRRLIADARKADR